MGTWSTGIFADDEACDVRDRFRDLINDGVDTKVAVTRLVAECLSSSCDAHERAVFWMALAATAWKCGRLTPLVRRRALACIAKGADLARWEEDAPRLVKSRRASIDKLRLQLLSPQRPPTKLHKRYRHDFGWRPGDAIAFRLHSGRTVIFRVLGLDKSCSSEIPVLDIALLRSRKIPGANTIARAPRRRSLRYKKDLRDTAQFQPDAVEWVHATDGKFLLCAHSKRGVPNDRWERVATGMRIQPAGMEGSFHFSCADLDESLKRLFGLE